jgi:hypothetical protein
MLISGVWLLRGTTARWKLARVLQGIAGVAFLGAAILFGVISLLIISESNKPDPIVQGIPDPNRMERAVAQKEAALFILCLFVLPSAVCAIVSLVTFFHLTRALKDLASAAEERKGK